MVTLITSCGRTDLLNRTIDSLLENQKNQLLLCIHEDKPGHRIRITRNLNNYILSNTNGKGQHGSIAEFVKSFSNKYYLHCEDDWEFNNTYNWIAESVKIMEADPMIIKVVCRDGSPHPCAHDTEKGYGILDPWYSEGILWHGFTWNPGVTRLDLLKQFIPFGKWEQDVAEAIYKKGYKVAELIKPVYKHIGDGRSTHE